MSSCLSNLSKVDVYVSIVLTSSLDETWAQARDFSSAAFWAKAGDFSVRKMKGRASSEIGASRLFKVGTGGGGGGRLYEQLTALDDYKHNMRWILVSHPHTLSPFGNASFLNYSSKLRFRKVTNTDETFGEWKGQFYTEPQYAEEMESVLSGWYHAGFEGLQVSAGGETPNRATMMDAGRSVPVAPPANDQAAFHGPTRDADLAYYMTNWASRKFSGRDPQAALRPQSPPRSDARPGGTYKSSSSQRSSGFGQTQTTASRFSDQHLDAWQARSLSPPSPRTAPIQDTIYQRSSSNSSLSSQRQSLGRSTSSCSQQSRESLSSPYQYERQGIVAHGAEYQPYLQSITEEYTAPCTQPLSEQKLGRSTQIPRYGSGSWSRLPQAQHTNASEQMKSPLGDQYRNSGGTPFKAVSSRQSIPDMPEAHHWSGHPAPLSTKSSLDSNARNSHKSGGSYRSSNSQSQPRLYRGLSQSDLNQEMNDQLGSSNQRHGGLPTHDEWERNAQPGGASVFVQSTDTREPCCDTTVGPHEQQNTFPDVTEWHEESSNEDDSADKDLEKAERSSLDEQVLFLQQRHSVMHNTGDPEKGCTSPFADSYGQYTNPFLQASGRVAEPV